MVVGWGGDVGDGAVQYYAFFGVDRDCLFGLIVRPSVQ